MNIEPKSDNALKQAQYADASKLNARIRLHTLYSTAEITWDAFILEQLALRDGESVLELGCGNGSQTRHNAVFYPAALFYHMADFSVGMMAEAVNALAGDARFSFSSHDAQALPFKSASFDLVSANHMLYHLPDIALGLSEIHRVLKPGGRLVAATNGLGHMADLDALIEAFAPAYQRAHAFHGRFNLENGQGMIMEKFGNCEMTEYESDLWVSDAEHLTAYVMSMEGIKSNIRALDESALKAFFQAKIDRDSGILIRKSSGVLKAVKR